MPSGLHALGIERAPNIPRIAEFLADAFPVDGYAGFSNISSLPAGHLLRWSDGKLERRQYWDPAPRELSLRSDDEYVEAFREQIDTAVRSRLRGCDGRVATQLSSGYDSGTVTATAARLLRNEGGTVTAFTAAPRLGFDGFVPRGRLADESAIAAMTAALYPNVEHFVLRPDGTSPLQILDDLHRFAQFAGGHICNHTWWTAIQKQVSARGIKVLLTGEQGNLTLSAGGPQQLADLIRTGRWLAWLREAFLAPREMGMTWKGVLASSLGPWLPRRLWVRLAASHGVMAAKLNEPFLLAEPFRSQMMALHRSTGRDPRPPRNSFALRCRLLQRQDSGNFRKAALAQWGLDERDPTADSRLISFCLSLPPDRLLKNGVRRPLAQKALADRLPEAVLKPKARGLQMADWYEHITPSESAQLAERLSRSAAASTLIDFGRVRELIGKWPPPDWEGWDVEAEYRGALLRSLAAAHFVAYAEGPLTDWQTAPVRWSGAVPQASIGAGS
ncbi:MAG TPA: asparagine synthetase B family protein [Allosphingosinicella sp.]|nr:asparagine synthetase B family protein [Allosphingosinicella sp.]